MTSILGFDSFIASTGEQPSTREPGRGLFMAATPEYQRELQEKQKLLDYLTLRAADMFEPEQDLLH